MFNYNEYKNIINLIKVYLPVIDFSDINDDIEKFCVVRHDIEFSIDRALTIAKIETNELGISSTYTIQLRNKKVNKDEIIEILKNDDPNKVRRRWNIFYKFP